MIMNRSKIVRWVIPAACLITLGGAGIAGASVPDSGGVIHGCYHPQSDGHNSALGVIDTALSNGHCPSGQTELTWNQTGPQGPQGATGAQGPAGPQGPAGAGGISGWEKVLCVVDGVDGSHNITSVSGSHCSFTDTTLTVTCPTGKVTLNAFDGIPGQGFEDQDSTGPGWVWTYDSSSAVTFTTNFGGGPSTAVGHGAGLLCAEGS